LRRLGQRVERSCLECVGRIWSTNNLRSRLLARPFFTTSTDRHRSRPRTKMAKTSDPASWLTSQRADRKRRYFRLYRRAARESSARDSEAPPRKRPAAASSRRVPRKEKAPPRRPKKSKVKTAKSRLGESHASSRSASRHRRYACCGHRRARCKCDWKPVLQRLRKAAWLKFIARVRNAEVLNVRDAAGSAGFLRRMETHKDLPLWQLWFWSVVGRRFCRMSTWLALEPHLGEPPNWQQARNALLKLKASGAPLFAARSSVLQQYRWTPTRRWRHLKGEDVVGREILAIKLIHAAIPKELLKLLRRGAEPRRIRSVVRRIRRAHARDRARSRGPVHDQMRLGHHFVERPHR